MDIHLLERLKDIVRSAGTTVRSAQDAAMGIREKSSHVDLVTLYDPMVQEFLRSRLMTLLPEAGFLGEEDATHDIAGRRQLFIVDPIDGTMNFIRGLHHSSISVALAVDGVVTHAVVYNPYYDEMFSAQRGKGAWLNGQRLHVTQHAVHDSLVLFGSASTTATPSPRRSASSRPFCRTASISAAAARPRWTAAMWPRAGRTCFLSADCVRGTMPRAV